MKEEQCVTNFQQKNEKLKEHFRRICLAYGAPLYYSQAFIQSLASIKYGSSEEQYKIKTYIIADEINQFKKGQSFHQSVNTLLEERQEVIRSLRQQLINNRNQKQMNLSQLCQKISHIRMYNLTIIEQLETLTNKLKLSNSKYTISIFNRLLRDIDFLRTSSLRKYIQFSKCEDPLFLIPLKKFWNLQLNSNYHRKPVVELFTLDDSYLIRLQIADKAIKNAFKKLQAKGQHLKIAKTEESEQQDVEGFVESLSQNRPPTQRKKNQALSNFFFPPISKRNDKKYPESTFRQKQQTKSENSIHNLIYDYEQRQKLKKRYDRYLQNDQKTKKRALTQANEYSQEKDRNYSIEGLIKDAKSKNKKFYIDDYYNDEPQSIYLKQGPRKQQIMLQSINKADKSSKIQSGFKLNQSNLQTYDPQKEPLLKSEEKIKDNLIANAKSRSNRQRYSKIINKFQPQESRSTIYNNCSSEPNRNEFQDPAFHIQQNSNKPKIMATERKVKTPTIYEQNKANDEMKDKRYKNPFDVLKEIRHRKKDYQIKIVKYDQVLSSQQENINKQSDQIEEVRNQASKLGEEKKHTNEQQLTKQNLLVTKQGPKLQLSSLNINETISKQQTAQKKANLQINSYQSSVSSNTVKQQNIASEKSVRKKQLSLQKQYHIQSFSSRQVQQTIIERGDQIYSTQKGSQNYLVRQPQLNNNSTSPLQAGINQHSVRLEEQENVPKYSAHDTKLVQNISLHHQQTIQLTSRKQFGRKNLALHPNTQVSQLIDQNQIGTSKKQNTDQSYLLIPKNTLYSHNSSENKPKSQAVNYNTTLNKSPKIQSERVHGQLISSMSNNYPDSFYQSTTFPSKNIAPPETNIFLLNENGNQNESFQHQKQNNISFDESKQSRLQNQPSNKQSIKPSFSIQQASILKKCFFQSKSIEQNELISILKSFSRSKAAKIIELTHKGNYFMNRHLIFSTCSFNNQIICFCLTSPYMTIQSRYLFILHLEIIQQSFVRIAPQLIYTFIKYLFYNDPTNSIIYLRLRQLFEDQYIDFFEEVKNYEGEIKTPIKSQNFDDKSYLFSRKLIKCNKSQDYTTIFNTIALYLTTTKEDIQLKPPKNREIYFSSKYLHKIQQSIKAQQGKNFKNLEKLDAYLQSQKLPHFRQNTLTDHLNLYEMIFEDCLTKVRFYAYAKHFYFTIEPPHTYLYQSQDIYYLLISTSFKNKYFILADKIYEESEHIDLYQHFKEKVMNKKINELFMKDKLKGKIVACPQFKKKVEVNFAQNTSGVIVFELNWKDYIKGARYFRQQQIYIELIGPFLCGLVELSEDNSIKHIYSTIIETGNIQK